MSYLKCFACSAAVLLSFGIASITLAQATKPATDYPDSRIDIYAGYGYIHPVNSDINQYKYQPVSNLNTTVSVAGYFNHYFGIQAEGSYFSGNGEHLSNFPNCPNESCDQLYYTAQAGPVFRLPLGRFVPFAHVLGGGWRSNGPAAQPLKWGYGFTAGTGVDYILPFFDHHLALRLVQADFEYGHVNYGPITGTTFDGTTLANNGGEGSITAYKLSGGLVGRFGGAAPKPPVQYGCSVAPAHVYPGDPLTVTGNVINNNPKKKPVYTWHSNGGAISGTGSTASIDTKGMKAGEYVVHGTYSEGSRTSEQASCDAPFTILAFEPPTISCSATPNTGMPGTDVAISSTASSPQNRPLTYSYSSTAGTINGSTANAMLSTTGASPGTVTVTCNVVDDLGQTAQATTMITLTAPPAAPAPATQSLCSVSFDRDKRRPVRVDNEAKACLDDIALTMNQKADAHLVIVGDYTAPEKQNAAEERAINVRQYLTEEKGIDASRIELRVGSGAGKTVTDTLVPAGATYADTTTQAFDEKTVVRHGQAYGKPKAKSGEVHHTKHTAAPPATNP
jgi:outer membrane protein OmpA-like peptidoglycan-associated protein